MRYLPLILLYLGPLCVMQKLATLKMAIPAEGFSQKQVALEAGLTEPSLARKLCNQQPLTFQEFDRFPEDVQRAALLEMLVQMGLPARVHRWIKVAQAVEIRKKQRSA